MHSPTVLPESPMDQDDVVYPCKGCGEILEEGKAFELAGNRWHIDCFRCHTCHTLLDSDANLLLLGDGSLICNNCTYSCSACSNKIEDLAILTGDQAFCASCFRCRNCKNKIENLRYARTSHGIFCMNCHEALMQKRRKNRNKNKHSNPNGLNKALPDVPRELRAAFPDSEDNTPPSDKFSTDTFAEAGADSNVRRSKSRREQSSQRDVTSEKENLTLPASTYQASQAPMAAKSGPATTMYNDASVDDGFFVPLVLDPNPAAATSPLSNGRDEPDTLRPSESRDYFNRGAPANRDLLGDPRPQTSRSSSSERKPGASPHIAYQEKGRLQSNQSDNQKQRGVGLPVSPRPSDASHSSAMPSQNEFRLQDAPRPKKNGSRRSSKGDARSPSVGSPPVDGSNNMTLQLDHDVSGHSPNLNQIAMKEHSQVQRPKRGDSLQAVSHAHSLTRKEVPGPSPVHRPSLDAAHDRQTSSSRQQYDSYSQLNGGKSISRPIDTSSKNLFDSANIPPPARSASRINPGASDAFTSPRPAPATPTTHKANESGSTFNSDHAHDYSLMNLPRYSGGGELMDDPDMARAMRGDSGETMLRKVSNAVKGHGRSFSDRGGRLSGSSQKHAWHVKSPLNGSVDISSPTSASSSDAREENILLKNQLRRSRQKIAELEAEKVGLESMLNSSADIRQANTELKEKRSTMAVLDTQREILVRELEVMTDHLKRVKDSNQVIDVGTWKSDVLGDFAASLQKLKDSMTSQVEELMQKRNELTKEIAELIQMKDKGFQEYESLSSRNAQLHQHNNELIQSIQDQMKASRAPNGLGLYLTKEKSDKSEKSEQPSELRNDSTISNLVHDNEPDPIITTPHVVKIKQTKPNMLKKGGLGKTLRGIRGALVSDRTDRNNYQTEGTPYSQIPEINMAPKSGNEFGKNKFGGFFSDRNGARHLKNLQNSSNPSLTSESINTGQLFGTDLSLRCDFEKRAIPCIVIRCIEEVEMRGMDVEGVYRKSGGSGQVNAVRAGFEASNEYDISDPDLDIHAITSALKQYFRRLPVPLITFDVYDQLLDAARGGPDRDHRSTPTPTPTPGSDAASAQAERDAAKAVRMREAINCLPKAHRDCLEFLVFHLARVMGHEKDNLMTPLNLAVVFAPTIMRPRTIEREMTDMQAQRITVQSMLELNKQIFEVGS